MTEDDCGDLVTAIIAVLVCALIGAAVIGFMAATRPAAAAECLTRAQVSVHDGGHPRYHMVGGRRCWYTAGRRRHAEAAAAPLPGGERTDPPAEVAIDQDPWHDPVWRGDAVPKKVDSGPPVAEVIADRFVAVPPAPPVPVALVKDSPRPPPRNMLTLLGLLLLAGATAFGASVIHDWWSGRRSWRARTAVVRVPPPAPPVPVERPDELQRARSAFTSAIVDDLPSASAAALRAVMR